MVVDSVVGRGTTFTLYLPRVGPERLPADGEAGVDNGADRGSLSVLVVEDNQDVGSFAIQMLTELGHATVWAADAEQALAELGRDAGRFDVVFSDIIMPGMNGIDLAREIRRLHGDLPVVLASGYSQILAQDGSHGFDLLQKPYSVDQLTRALRRSGMRKVRTAERG